MKNYIALFVVSIESLKNLKHHTFSKKHYFFVLFALSAKMKKKRYIKKNNQFKYSKFLF